MLSNCSVGCSWGAVSAPYSEAFQNASTGIVRWWAQFGEGLRCACLISTWQWPSRNGKQRKKNETWGGQGHAQGQRAWALTSQFSSQGSFHSPSSIFQQRSELGSSASKVIWKNFTQASVFPGLGFNGGWGISGWWNFPEVTWSRLLANPVNVAQLFTY